MKQPVRILLTGLIGGFFLAVIVSTASTFIGNYSNTDGFVLPDGNVVGGDFICFYVAGQLAREDIRSLYDYELQRQRQLEMFEGKDVGIGLLPFIYPPLVAYLFSLLSPFTFLNAYFAWLTISMGLFVASMILLLKPQPTGGLRKGIIFLAGLAFVPFSINCLAAGQTSCMGLFIYALVYFLLKSGKDGWAGAALGLSYYKPPIFLIFVLFMLLRRRWKMLSGFAVMGALLMAGTVAVVGVDGLAAYVEQASSYRYGVEVFGGKSLPPSKGAGLLALLFQALPEHRPVAKVIFAIAAAIGLAFGFRYLSKRDEEDRGSAAFDLGFAFDVSLSLLLSVQMVIYDVTIMLVPMVLLFARASFRMDDGFNRLACVAAAGLFVEFLFRYVSVGSLTIASTALFLILWVVALGGITAKALVHTS